MHQHQSPTGFELRFQCLPGLDGHHVARQLRKAYAGQLLIVAATGRSSFEDRQLSQEAGCDYHKPLDFQLLHRILDEWMKNGGCQN